MILTPLSDNYSSPPWKIAEFFLTLGLGLLITMWWRAPDSIPQWMDIRWFHGLSMLVPYLVVRLKWLQHKADSKSAAELKADQKAVVNALNTMPPVHAMETFVDAYTQVLADKRIVSDSGAPETEEQIKEHIKALKSCVTGCLEAYANLYVQFEYKRRSGECHVHWLPHSYIEEVNAYPDFQARVLSKIQFVDNPDNPLLDIDGVLHVDPAFTVVVDNKPGNASKVDSGVEEMYLPMNSDRSNDTGNGRCFPVAPMALKNEDMVWIPNAEKHITHEYLRSWDINMQVLNDLYDYFRTKQPVGSVIANPLVYGDTKLGVVVIFTQNSDSKDGRAVVDSYLTLCRPLFEMQKDIVCDIVELESELKSRQSDSPRPEEVS